MRIKLVWIVPLALLAATPAWPARPLEMGDLINKKGVVLLLHAKGVNTLEKVYGSLPYSDPAVEVVYRSLRLKFEPSTDAERELINTIPKNPVEYLAFLSLLDPDIYNPNDAALSGIVYGYFERVARLIHKHGRGMRSFFLLQSFTDGEVRDSSTEWFEWLVRNDRKEASAVFNSFAPEMREEICGDCAIISEK